jgi:hypothetical protein
MNASMPPSLAAIALLLAVQDIQISGQAGWGGRTVRGDYTPILIDLDNRSGEDRDLVLKTVWAAPEPSQRERDPSLSSLSDKSGPVHLTPVTLPARTRKRITLTLLAPDDARYVPWIFADHPRKRVTFARATLPVRDVDPARRLVGVIGRAVPEGLAGPGIELGHLLPDELPEESSGYFSLAAVLWTDGRAGEIRSPAQAAALREWIRSGGRFGVLHNFGADLSGSAVADLVPVRASGSREFLLLDGIRSVTPPPEGSVLVAESKVLRGHVRLEQEEVPLVVDSTLGAGRISFVAFDPTRPPFKDWKGGPAFWNWLLGIALEPRPRQEDGLQPPSSVGSLDLARLASQFPDVEPPAIGHLFGLILLYLLLVGPFDYALLRFLKRLELTWFTFPAYVAGFTVVILVAGGAFLQRAAYQRELAVVDHYADGGPGRSRSVAALLVPSAGHYGLRGGAEPVSSNFISRAMYGDSNNDLGTLAIRHDPATGTGDVDGWRLERLSTGLALHDRPDPGPAPLRFSVRSRDGQGAVLEVTNPSGTAYESALLVTPDGVYWFTGIPVDQGEVKGTRNYVNLESFLQAHGSVPSRNGPGSHGWPRASNTISEEAAREPARRCLVGLSFDTGNRSGVAARLGIRPWIEAGGSVLLAWPRTSPPILRFDPAPSRHTSVVLHRYFQGPAP